MEALPGATGPNWYACHTSWFRRCVTGCSRAVSIPAPPRSCRASASSSDLEPELEAKDPSQPSLASRVAAVGETNRSDLLEDEAVPKLTGPRRSRIASARV